MTKHTPRMLAIGKANQDVFLSGKIFKAVNDDGVLEEQFELGAKLPVEQVVFATGGNAMNASVTFARQGLQAELMCMLGTEPSGRAVVAALDHEGVGTNYVVQDERFETSYSTILLAPSGERTILTYQGAHPHDTGWPFDLDALKQADWLYVSSVGSMALLEKVITIAANYGVQVAFNPGSRELQEIPKVKALLEDVAILMVNRDEAKLIVEGSTWEELLRHTAHLVPVAVISDGARGAMVTDRKKIVKAGVYKDVQVLDRTGAGDAFCSGFVAMYAQGKSLEEAVLFASANSTGVVGAIGATTGILHRHAKLYNMPLDIKQF